LNIPVLACACIVSMASAQDVLPLTLVQSIPLPVVEGRIDHFALDTKDQRLYVAALGNNTVEVIDLAAGKVIHQITGLKEPQGVVVIPEPHEVVVANGDDGSVRFYDANTWVLVKTVDLKDDADNVRYDHAQHRVYVGFGDGGIAAIDVTTHAVVATIPLTGHPEAFALETVGSRIFVNVPNAHLVAVLDRKTAAVTATWDLGNGFSGFFTGGVHRPSSNFPMALDEPNHRLFIGCRKPSCVVVFDLVANKPIAQIEVSGGTDDLFYDQTTKQLYVSCGDGAIDVISQSDVEHYQRTARIATASGARTAFWSSEQRRLYLAVPHRRTQPAAVMVFQAVP
jgi:YVTN family beta-propeller protein